MLRESGNEGNVHERIKGQRNGRQIAMVLNISTKSASRRDRAVKEIELLIERELKRVPDRSNKNYSNILNRAQ